MHDHYIHLIVGFCSGYIETKPERYQNRLVISLNIFSPFDITLMFLVIIRSQVMNRPDHCCITVKR